MESHLNQPHFQDEEKAREYLEALRWPNGPVCPHCGSVNKDHSCWMARARLLRTLRPEAVG